MPPYEWKVLSLVPVPRRTLPDVPPVPVWGPVLWRLLHHLENVVDEATMHDFLERTMATLPAPYASPARIPFGKGAVAYVKANFYAGLGHRPSLP